MSEELIIKEIESNEEEYIEFFRELIQTDSYNPPGNEKNVALKIESYLKKSNIKCEVLPFGENRANLISYLNENFEGKNLLYNGHMDVVPPGSEKDWKYPPLSAFIKRKKFIYGRGTTDMKGGLAAMVIALKVLKKLELDLSGNLILNAVADEETGGKFGTGWCLNNRLNKIPCNFVIVGEATNFTPLSHAILVGEKGRIQLKIIANGTSCHASVPFLGKNPIYMMSNILQNLEKLNDYVPKIEPPIPLNKLKELVASSFPSQAAFERVYKEQPLLSNVMVALTQFTYSVTMINAGIKENVVPDKCEAKMDIRLLPGQTIDTVIKGLKKIITDIGYPIKENSLDTSEGVYVSLEIEEAGEPSFWKDWESSEILKNLYNIVEKVYQKKPFYFLLPASADAVWLRNTNYCPETVIFGPGIGTSAHAVDEYVEIQDFINAIKVYTLFAYNFLK